MVSPLQKSLSFFGTIIVIDQVVYLTVAAIVVVEQLMSRGNQFAGNNGLVDRAEIDNFSTKTSCINTNFSKAHAGFTFCPFSTWFNQHEISLSVIVLDSSHSLSIQAK